MRDLSFIASSHEDLIEFPEDVRREVGFALYLAQSGDKAINVVPLLGFGGASVLEVITNHQGDTFRAVYTVRFAECVYVLHAFKKKSKRGKETPLSDMRLVRMRLKEAESDYAKRKKQKEMENQSAG